MHCYFLGDLIFIPTFNPNNSMNVCVTQLASLPDRKPKHTGAALRRAASRNDIIAKPL
jgi:hypothetical protein